MGTMCWRSEWERCLVGNPLAYELADRLHSAAIHLLRRARRGDPLTGATPAQLSALSVLMGGPRTLGDLAAAERVRAPTISRLATEMERIGLLRRSGDPDDGRVAGWTPLSWRRSRRR
ncbi:MAG: MarR family transcriptional regulator, partial [Chloroflexota bacterium]